MTRRPELVKFNVEHGRLFTYFVFIYDCALAALQVLDVRSCNSSRRGRSAVIAMNNAVQVDGRQQEGLGGVFCLQFALLARWLSKKILT